MTTEADFIAALDADPDSHMTRLAFADWLEEQDPPDPRGPGYRALGANGVFPHGSKDVWVVMWNVSQYKGYVFGQRLHPHDPLDCSPAMLPDDWHQLIAGKVSSFVKRRHRREMEDAAALAFARLPAQRRAELLATVEMPA